MVFGGRGRFLLISCLFLQFTGTIFATDENAARRQYVFNATENYNPAVACTDSTQRSDICALAGKRCHCEENRYEMYTYCKRSCGYCNEERLPQRFWRVVNWAPLNRTWFVSEIQFFKSRHDKNPLPTNIAGNAIASSTYLSFPASHAFDGNRDTAWLPDGWWERIAGGDWIGYDFPTPVDINSVRVISDYNDTSDVAAKILVEAGPTAFGPFQTRWMSINGDRKPDKRFNNPRCPLFWKRFMTDKYAFCYKLVTEYLTWSEARDKCGAYGGDLVSINTHEEQVFVQQELLACGYTWLGLNDRAKEAEFTWSDSGKNSTFFYWADDIESDDRMNDMEDCVAMQKNGEWRTFHCDNRFYFFCKKRILTDNDKIVEPNTAQRPTQPINQTLPEGVPPPVTPLPPEIEFPPGVTPPPPPPYPYPYPTPYPQHRPTYGPPATAPGIFMQQIMQHLGRITQQILNPKGTPTAAPPATQTPTGPAPAPPPDTGGPAPATPPAAPPVPGLPPPAPGAQPPTPAAQPPVPAALPPVVAPPPVAPPPVVAPAPHPKHHKHHVKKAKKKHHKAFHSTIKYRRKKRVKRNHKKKAAKKNIKKQWHDKMEADDDFKMDDDFLDMFTRSNIPQPKISENQLRSNVKKEQVQNAQEQQKEDTIQANSSS